MSLAILTARPQSQQSRVTPICFESLLVVTSLQRKVCTGLEPSYGRAAVDIRTLSANLSPHPTFSGPSHHFTDKAAFSAKTKMYLYVL